MRQRPVRRPSIEWTNEDADITRATEPFWRAQAPTQAGNTLTLEMMQQAFNRMENQVNEQTNQRNDWNDYYNYYIGRALKQMSYDVETLPHPQVDEGL